MFCDLNPTPTPFNPKTSAKQIYFFLSSHLVNSFMALTWQIFGKNSHEKLLIQACICLCYVAYWIFREYLVACCASSHETQPVPHLALSNSIMLMWSEIVCTENKTAQAMRKYLQLWLRAEKMWVTNAYAATWRTLRCDASMRSHTRACLIQPGLLGFLPKQS